jgi:hypothetical protein
MAEANNNGAKELPSLQDLNNETVDLEHIPVEEVFAQLRCTKEGLTTDEGNNRLAIFGSNKLEEKVVWPMSILFPFCCILLTDTFR